MIRERQCKGFIEGCLSIKGLKDLEKYVYGSLMVINTSFDSDLYFWGQEIGMNWASQLLCWTVWAAGYQQGIEDVQCTPEVLQPVNHKSRLSTKFVKHPTGFSDSFVQCWKQWVDIMIIMKNAMVSHVSDFCWNVTAIYSNTVLYLLYHSYWNHHVCKGNHNTSETKSPHNRLLRLYWWMYQQPESGHFLHREGWSFPCNWSAESSKKKIIANACAGQWDVFLFHMWQVSQN